MNVLKTITKIALAAGITAIGIAALITGASAGDLPGRPPIATCIGPAIVGATGLAIKQSSAKSLARQNWRRKAQRVKNLYANWDLSAKQGGHYHCNKKAGTWRCAAHGYPCSMKAGLGK